MKEKVFEEISIHRKNFMPIFFLILNSVTWFYLIIYVGFMAPEPIPFASSLQWLFYLTVLVSMLIGPIIEKINKMRFLFFWILLGIISSLFPIFLTSSEYEVALLLISWGFAFGIGFPSCLALIPLLTRVEERGRVSGVIFLATYLTLFTLMILIGRLNLLFYSLALAAWRSLSFFALSSHISMDDIDQLKPVSYRSVLQRRKFFIYFLPWLIFCLTNYFEVQVFEQLLGKSIVVLIGAMEFTIGSLFCFVGGWLMDLKGRKWVIIMGLVMLGLGYALLSFFPFITFTQAFFILVDGIAFGIFTVAFISVIWGDISNGERAEKFYALGNSPVPIAVTLSLFLSPWLRMLDASRAFSLASFFIFLAIIPIFFAPELLPEKVLRKRELKKYVEEVKKIAGRT
jgi:MFS family permease